MPALKRREQRVVGAGAVLLAAAAVTFVILLPATDQVRLARREAAGKQAELRRLGALVDRRAEIERRHRLAQTEARVLEAMLPRDPALPALLGLLGRAISDSRVELQQISFAPAASTSGGEALPAGVAAVPMQVVVSGEYSRLRAFVAALERMPRAVTVDRFAVTGADRGVTIDLTLRAFYAP
ncbi:MAG: type 4a pilus biogenesis protein PilO [Armatimonadota bacterium]|nr:type 4a pilus biogenesis protein PilO [Armatimonadota bacterium]MDR7451935.1 type 4a pilus biogenesis protein PilO [Armatimonadota bacterium]MDR7466617.1 type 4a pilus biogenesis protein PilO [Armatimonadota bacterium]MDR7492909.1 type 4a pilus biogenesis protein PilO [Armatimonadota bacterium]MDR7504649.1 type 4a pilus biogenesis protein PilO [Armatimonadota bacterium]